MGNSLVRHKIWIWVIKMSLIAVLDANVLYPAPLRDLLLHIAFLAVYQPKWSDKIQQEWIQSLLSKRSDLKQSSLANTRKWMETIFPDAQTQLDDKPIPSINLPDKDDIHIFETAIRADAKYIITFNLKDFPMDELKKFEIKAIHPDDFVCLIFKDFPEAVLQAFNNQVNSLKNPPKSVSQVLSALEKCGLPKTKALLKKLL